MPVRDQLAEQVEGVHTHPGDGREEAAGDEADAHGQSPAGTNPAGIGFTGHVNDADTGLVYMQQRYYDPLAGRFLSVDPVVTD
ncbi:MAG: hypothetical protein K2X82_16415, partial [Gemmataceae bacterium]|nr:hypothetical protein [Gemmataceae bacterium]